MFLPKAHDALLHLSSVASPVGNGPGRGLPPVAIARVPAPKRVLSKWLFKLLNEEGVWQELLQNKYLNSNTLSQVKVRPSGVWLYIGVGIKNRTPNTETEITETETELTEANFGLYK